MNTAGHCSNNPQNHTAMHTDHTAKTQNAETGPVHKAWV